MSSVVKRRDRKQRPERTKLSDFSEDERRVIEAARGWFPGPMVVIGSRARGNWAEDSDIDIGVTGYQYSLHNKAVEYMQSTLPIKIDVFKIEHALTHGTVIPV